MEIKEALPEDLCTVKEITRNTIKTVYPKYYPVGVTIRAIK